MRILREDNDKPTMEELPVSFITDMMSKGWDEVGYLKEAAAAIRETYAGTEKVEELMQDLMDAYLVFIGQLEFYLNDKADISTEKPEDDEAEDTEDDKSESEPKDDDKDEEDEAAEEPAPAPALPEAEFDVEPMKAPVSRTPAPAPIVDDDFDFFVDFDEPDMTQAPVTDAELYDDEGAPKTRRLNG